MIYGNQEFRALFKDGSGKDMQAVLRNPDGAGDGTVPSSSAGVLNAPGKVSPGDADMAVEHQPAYQDDDVQAFAVKAILALVKKRYYSLRVGDFPAQGSAASTG